MKDDGADYASLIARLESAEVDKQGVAIHEALSLVHKNSGLSDDAYDRALRMLEVDAYESAALMLMPEGWPWRLGDHYGTDDDLVYEPHAYLIEPMVRTMGTGKVVDGLGATPAIAICTAALRARQAQEAEG